MIDKSIRQHYQTGEKVKKFGYDVGQKLISPYVDEGGKLDVGKVAKTALTNKLTSAATKKLAGTGILSSLGPIGMLIAFMLAKRGMKYASGKIPDIKTSLQAFQTGFGSPQEQKELKKLEKSRAWMLNRKEEGKGYSEKNLDMVTRAIAEAKGLDINNPNEMKNIDKPITQIQIEKSVTEPPQIIPKTPEIISPHLLGGDKEIIPPKVSPISYEDDFATTTIKDILDKKTSEDIITPPVWNPGIAAQEEAEKQAAFDRAVAENKAKAAAEAAAARVWTPPVHHHTGGGGGGNGGGGQAAADAAGGSSYSSPFLKGGRVDKALSGRSRDI